MTPSWDLIRRLAVHSANAYAASTAYSDDTDASADVFLDDNKIIVAVKGSSTPLDFVQDADFILVPYKRGMVHQGFYRDAMSIVDQVAFQVQTLAKANPEASLMLCGHSLGGGQAPILALELDMPVAQIVTFGKPRCGNEEFAAFYDSKFKAVTWRVVNENDIVPRLPSPPLYWHVGHEIFLPVEGGYDVDPSPFQRIASDIIGLGEAMIGLRDVLIQDHYMTSYIPRMADLTEKSD